MNATASFLAAGLERLELEDIHPFWGGRRMVVHADGRVELEQQPQNVHHTDSVDAEALVRTVVENDLLGFPDPPSRAIVPDEACPAIILVNRSGERRQRAIWANDRVAAFDHVYRALLDLERRISTSL